MLTVVGIVLMVFGAVIASVFSGFELATISGFAVTMFGAGLATANMWKTRKAGSKTWLTVLSICLVGVGAFIAGFTGQVSENQVTTIIGYAVAFASLIAGLITNFIAIKKASK